MDIDKNFKKWNNSETPGSDSTQNMRCTSTFHWDHA